MKIHFNHLRQLAATCVSSVVLFSSVSVGFANEAPSIEQPAPALVQQAAAKPFHIGIFNPPSPEHVNAQSYAEIAGMNVNFIVGGNSHYTYDVNDRALQFAADNGLKILVTDTKFGWDEPTTGQTATDHTVQISSSHSWGQTFLAPDRGTDWGLNYISLNIDKQSWPSNAKLTLSLYDSPAKQTLVGSAAVTGPGTINNNPTIFWVLTRVNAHEDYYLELTSDSTTAVNLAANGTDAFPDGQAYENGNAVPGSDLWFTALFSESVFKNGGEPALSALQDVVNHYGDHPALMGYNLYDEPPATKMMSLGNMSKSLRTLNPNAMSLVNLLPIDAPVSLTGIEENRDGSILNTSSVLGQTFTTKSYQNKIEYVQWYIPSDQWQSGEGITLTLWDSPTKNEQIAQTFLGQVTPGVNNQTFTLNADVEPNTSYYMELVHNGGGDNFFGVWRSSDGTKWYHGGQAYVNGQPISADFWHAINQDVIPFTYEDYVNRWVRTEPDVLLYDYYPYLYGSNVSEHYYKNLEVIRRQAQQGHVDFWTFIQSVGIGEWLRPPSENDIRHNIYTNLAYGSKGLIYFTYSHPIYPGYVDSIIDPNGNRNPSYNWAKNLNAEVLNLGETLNKLESVAVYHTGSAIPPQTQALPASFFWQPDNSNDPWIISSFEDADNNSYIMVVNRDHAQAHTGTFTLSTKPGQVKEISKATGQETGTGYNPTTGVLQASFQPGEGRLYAIDLTPANLAPEAQSQQLIMLENTTAVGTLHATDAEEDALTYALVDNGSLGTAVITNAATGAFTYTPDPNKSGTDTFTYQVSDGSNVSNLATVTVTIVPQLGITVSPGSAVGTTKLTATVGTGHTLAVALESAAIPIPATGEVVPVRPTLTSPYTASSDINGAAIGKHLVAYELDSGGKVVKFASIELKAEHIQSSSGNSGNPYVPPIVVTPNPESPNKDKDKDGTKGEDTDKDNDKGSEGSKPDVKPGTKIEFSDIKGYWAYGSIMEAVSRGIINGYADGSFKPDNVVSRAEIITMLMRGLKSEVQAEATSFTDQKQIGSWAQPAIGQAIKLGYVKGYQDNTFRPNAQVTRQEFAAILTRILGQSPSATVTGIRDEQLIPAWAKSSIHTVVGEGLMDLQNDAKFNPQGFVSRAEAAIVIVKLMHKLEDKK